MLNDQQRQLIASAKKILIIQAENPDGDSVGSALALEEIFGAMGKDVALHCPVQIPTYLRHISGWDRVNLDFPNDADLAIIVDTSSKTLLSKTLENPIARAFLESNPVIALDHHVSVEPDLPFKTDYILSKTAVATGELIFDLAREENWTVNEQAATALFISIQADSLGLTTVATTAESFATCAKLVKLGASPAGIEEKRRELMKKSPEILKYKGQLIERIEYFNDGRTALINIPFDEIHEYSNQYNPTMLVLDEMRLVIGVDVAIGVKTYPDGKLTGKLRSNIPVSNSVAKFFGGDGHPFAAGFRIYEDYAAFVPELIQCLDKIYKDYDTDHPRETISSETNNSENSGSFRVKKG